MAGQHGSALYLEWITSSGTTVLNTDFRSLSESQSMDFVDETAGADEYIQRLKNRKDSSYSYTALYQNGGSAVWNAVVPGTDGTLKISPEGTSAGSPYTSAVVFVENRDRNMPYADVVEISVSFIQKTDWSESAW